MSPVLLPQMVLFLGSLISSESRGPRFPRSQEGGCRRVSLHPRVLVSWSRWRRTVWISTDGGK
jgi:hypothetical protein